MATELGLPAVVLPETGPSSRPLTFNHRMTERLGKSLKGYAEAYGKDQMVAERISDKYRAEFSKLDSNDPEYDLQSISLLFDVCIMFQDCIII